MSGTCDTLRAIEEEAPGTASLSLQIVSTLPFRSAAEVRERTALLLPQVPYFAVVYQHAVKTEHPSIRQSSHFLKENDEAQVIPKLPNQTPS